MVQVRLAVVSLLCCAVVGCWASGHIATRSIFLDKFATVIVPKKAVPRLAVYSEGVSVLDISVNPEFILSNVNLFRTKRNGTVIVPNYIRPWLQWKPLVFPSFDILRSVWRLDRWKDMVSWMDGPMISDLKQKCRSLSFIHAPYRKSNHISQLRMGYVEFLHVSDHPCTLRSNNVLPLLPNGIERTKCDKYSDEAKDGDSDVSHPQRFIVPSPHFRLGSRFADIYGGVLVGVGTFLTFTLIVVSTPILTIKFWTTGRGSRLGWILLCLAFIMLVLSAGSAFIGCLPSNWNRCLCDGEEHSEYRQTIQHNPNSIADLPYKRLTA